MKKKAVALRYERTRDLAPKVVAKGAGKVAERIVRTAKDANVTVYEDEHLAQLLMGLELDSVIPEDMYQAVAEVLSYVYQAGTGKS
ncbi:EscU/YscU/HrcU family type III secretion system export apparatus switch protein [Alicyclobacillus sp. SO9]|uniref:EscU/YscU/HrcU family type III secretion system export apparatus switch protein n=1 Tax=Alicyclobacillus sp. SO9 TaxID=2665646 RepID=UPI0018E81F75|nr:EscU/YscU/HrcU family type III secretion system export apparatus switch protein [Alicyclobacillus sp. SO9]QQE80788.1 EscU/YscU/HrcU family type III secretion system export apparatus switch protein [Alicyclobacillus sp. SO9]